MASWADIIGTLLAGLRSPVKERLAAAVREVERTRGGPHEIAALHQLIDDRLAEIQAESLELNGLVARLQTMARLHPYLPQGWPDCRAELQAKIAADPLAGTAAWLDYWFTAASEYRLDTLDRLLADVPLPVGAEVLTKRAETTVEALRTKDFRAGAYLLGAGRSGVTLQGRTNPDAGTRSALGLLLTRLALAEACFEEADHELKQLDPDLVPVAKLTALRAAIVAVADPAAAGKLILEASRLDPQDLDVCSELVRLSRPVEGTRSEAQFQVALASVQPAIDGMSTLVDVDSELGRLVDCRPELWLAVAERALRENDEELATRALDTVLSLNNFQDLEVTAYADQMRLRVVHGPAEERKALVEAGQSMIDAGHVKRARKLFKRAMEVTGEPDPEVQAAASIRWADCISVIAQDSPLADVRSDIETALECVLTARPQLDMNDTDSWSYLTEVQLRLQLARLAEPDRVSHQWSALLAACRAVVASSSARRWAAVSDAAQDLNAFGLGELAGRMAWKTGGEEWRPTYSRALMNNGKPHQALAELGTTRGPWSECLRGYALLLDKRPSQAAKLLATVDFDPTWTWAWQALAAANALNEDLDVAIAQARQFEEKADAALGNEPMREYDALSGRAWSAILQNDPVRAAAVAGELDAIDAASGRTEAAQLLGESLLLRGEHDAARQALHRSISRSTSPWNLQSWLSIERPYLEKLAAKTGRELGDLTPFDKLATERLAELGEAAPADELTAIPAEGVDPLVVKLTRAYRPILDVLADEPNDEELWADLSRLLVEAGEAVPVPTRATEDAIALADADEHQDTVEHAILVSMPGSWFADTEDPVREHSLFTRYLPELRAAANWEVPPIKVSIDEALEPDRYQIFAAGKLVGEGQVDPATVVLSEEARALVGTDESGLFALSGYEQLTEHLGRISQELSSGDRPPAAGTTEGSTRSRF